MRPISWRARALRPGEVTSDGQAFQQVIGRLEADVGTLLRPIDDGKSRGYFPSTAPFWTLAPEIEWPKIIGMRNVLVQGYFDIDTELVCQAASRDAPALRPHIEGAPAAPGGAGMRCVACAGVWRFEARLGTATARNLEESRYGG